MFSLHRIGEQSLLLDSDRHRVFALDDVAALVWRELGRGGSPERVGRTLSRQLGMDVPEAESYVCELVRQYEAMAVDDGAPDTDLDRDPARPVRPSGPARHVASYRLLGSAFRVHFSERCLFETVHPLIEFLAVEAGRAVQARDLHVARHEDGIAVFSGEQSIGRSSSLEQAAVALRACLVQLAVDAAGGLCALHAGALARGDRGLLLPGAAGRGKSTLSAALMTRGFELLSDDTAVLAGMPTRVRSLPAGLCLKRGAVDVLRPLYPELAAAREWRRPDGQWARYLAPGRDVPWAPPQAAVGVRWIVFPDYHPAHETGLRALARHQAVARLLPGTCFLSGGLDGRHLDRLIGWIEGVECYELPLSSLERATELVDGLCR